MIDDDERTNPAGLFNFAVSYWYSGEALEKIQVNVTHRDAPIFFLYQHAIELFLKSYLRAEEYTVNVLRKKFGHSFAKLYGEAKRLGLHFDDEDIEVLNYLWATDAVMDSRYIKTGYFERPANEALSRTCKSLHESVGEALRTKGIPVRF